LKSIVESTHISSRSMGGVLYFTTFFGAAWVIWYQEGKKHMDFNEVEIMKCQ